MNIREKFQLTEKLYHFTSFDTAKKIIESNSLRFGRLSNMNDLHENDKVTFVDINGQCIKDFPSDVLDALHDEIYRYRQISLTAEGEKGDELGFNLHQMWGHYADKGEGVCLVFDKNELMKSHDMPDITHDRVNYDKPEELVSFAVSNSEKPEEVVNEVSSKTKEIFFHKRKEWEHEQEYRLIKRCPLTTREEYFRLGHALKYVILTSKLSSIDEVRYQKKLKEIKEKLEKIEKERNIGDDGKIPIFIYGNGFFDYNLITEDREEEIWNSSDGYDILIVDENCEIDLCGLNI